MLVHPVLAWLSQSVTATSTEGPLVALATGASLALALSVGPIAAPLIAVVHVASAVLVTGDELSLSLLVAAVLQGGVVATIAVLLEGRFARLDEGRSLRVVLEFVLVAGLATPALLAIGDAAVSWIIERETPFWRTEVRDGLAYGLGLLIVAPGARMLLMRERLLAERADAAVVGLGTVATLVASWFVVEADGVELAATHLVAIPLLLVAFLAGSAAAAVTVLAVVVAGGVVATVVGPPPVEIGIGAHLMWWGVAALGLLLAAEGDRRRRTMIKLAALFGYAAAPSAEVSADGRILQVNRAFAAMLGWRPEELTGSDLLMLFATADDGVGVEALIAGHRDEVRGQAHVRTRGGSLRMVRYVGRRLHDLGTGDGLVLVQLLDMTDEERRAAALERSNDALEQLGHRISHDLKQPLAAIAGYASTLRVHRDRLDSQTVDEMLDRLDQAARRVVDQLDSMVASASLGGDRQAAVSLADVTEAVAGLVEIELREAGGRLDTSLEVDAVHTDGRALQQVVLNLVTNALKYHDSALPPTVRIASRVRDGGVEVAVIDNGPGIPHDALESVFEPGLRLAPGMAQGRGMGLADSRRTAEDLGGWLRAEPSAAGARFVMWLPDPDLAVPPGPVRTVCVDVGDATPSFRTGPSGAPPAEPVEVEHDRVVVVGRAKSVSEAISLTASLEPDVVFVDRWVADGDGLTALASLATAHPPARLVVRTRDGSDEAVRAALVSGATRAAPQGADGRAVSAMIHQVAG